jgi:hypothetical protein
MRYFTDSELSSFWNKRTDEIEYEVSNNPLLQVSVVTETDVEQTFILSTVESYDDHDDEGGTSVIYVRRRGNQEEAWGTWESS